MGLDVAPTTLAVQRARLLGEVGQTAYHFLLNPRFKMKVSAVSAPGFPEVKCHGAAMSRKCVGKPLGRPLGQIRFDINKGPGKGLLR